MKSGLLTYRKDRLSKWLFNLTVLCSIFALLPSINHSKFQQEKTQTELVCSSAVNTLSKTVPYHNITESVDNNKKINPFLIYQTSSLIHYTKVKINVDQKSFIYYHTILDLNMKL